MGTQRFQIGGITGNFGGPEFTLDERVRPAAEALLADLKASALRATMGVPVGADPAGFHALFAGRFAKLPADGKTQAVQKANAIIADPVVRQRELLHLASADIHSPTMLAVRPPVAHINNLLANFRTMQIVAGAKRPARIDFMLRYIKCEEETSWEPGSDEVLFGGSSVDPTGNTAAFNLGKIGDMGSGDRLAWDPLGRSVFSLDIGPQVAWPITVGAVVILGEEDYGGFPDWLRTLLQKLGDAAKNYISSAVGAAIGGALGGVIGAAIGAAIGWCIGKLIDWLAGLWNDDLIQQQGYTLTLDAPPVSRGTIQQWHEDRGYNGDGARYVIGTEWRYTDALAVVYEHANFGGRYQLLTPGRYDVGQLSIGNDAISSVMVPPGWRVTLYQHAGFQGATLTLITDTPAVSANWNDQASSILVEADVLPMVFEHNDYAGRSQALNVGRYDVSQLAIGNDIISSVKVPAGWKVTLFEHAGFQGAAKVITANTPGLPDFNDRASSLVVERL